MSTALHIDFSDLSQASRVFNKIIARSEDMSPLMNSIGGIIEDGTRHRFETQTGPDGQKWQDTHRGGNILVNEGHLRDSITSHAGSDEVEVGSNLIYAGVHQHGATIKPKSAGKLAFKIGSHLIFADQVTIPARPFLGIDAHDEANILAEAEAYLTEPWQ